MFQNIGRTLARAGAALALTAATLFALSAPASAHTLDQAARASAGCAWISGSYSTLHSSPVTTAGGATYGRVYLLWSSTYGQNCVVTLKTGSTHGTPTYTRASLYLQNGSGAHETGDYSHYAAASRAAAGVCVRYSGAIRGTTGTLATGGRSNWANCS
ncbi:hypothetical protein [Nocardiopsis alborubida]|uniref:Spore-associated protein A n=1 Tax=Nocardiopsis alborubida TaxID=146802 RepID=A0A7X6MDN4_9ACTN|nr:hypothetical protein [Nocardiopsis alborubida]NKY99601.1 hypothetical protein [Nocardiopsis alborubida]